MKLTSLALLSALVLLALVRSAAAEPPTYLTYDNLPLGTLGKPLILRTYMPDPDLGPEVFAHHGKGAGSPRYNVGEGRDVDGEYQPVKGIPAAIGVNHGAALSYCFDTTECRLMYAWQGGFLDMFPYWGDTGRGNRQSFNYVPHLVGNLFYKTSGEHPVHLDGKSLSAGSSPPRFLGYQLREGVPHFRYRAGTHTITMAVTPGTGNEFHLSLWCEPAAKVEFRPGGTPAPREGDAQTARFRIGGETIATYQGFPRDMGVKEATAENGEKLYLNYGCIACHSTDGSKGHGPTFAGLFGSRRPLEGGTEVLADEAYLLESIKAPNARTAQGFPPNYMPPYQLKELEYQALVAFLKNLGQPQ